MGVTVLILLAIVLQVKVSPSIDLAGRLYASEAWRLERSGQGTLAALHEDRLSGQHRSYAIRNVERGDVARFMLRDDLVVGSSVRAGDTLGVIESSLLNAQNAELDGLVAVAASELDALSAGEKPEAIQAIGTQLEQVREQISLQERIESRIRELQTQRLASDDELDRTRTELLALRGEAAVLEAQMRVLETGARAEDRRLARTRLGAAQEQLAALRARRDALAVQTPISGIVARATSDSVLVSVIDTSAWVVAVPVPLDRGTSVRPEMAVALQTPSGEVAGRIIALESTIVSTLAGPQLLALARPDSEVPGAAEGLPVRVRVELDRRLLRTYIWQWVQSIFTSGRSA